MSVCVCVCVCVCTCINVCVCVIVCLYVWCVYVRASVHLSVYVMYFTVRPGKGGGKLNLNIPINIVPLCLHIMYKIN